MKTILVIDDNNDLRENTAEILNLAGYKTLTAENGKRGVDVAIKEMPDLIVCDIMMPELDGYGVLHLLRKHPETQQIPFIFLTAKNEENEKQISFSSLLFLLPMMGDSVCSNTVYSHRRKKLSGHGSACVISFDPIPGMEKTNIAPDSCTVAVIC